MKPSAHTSDDIKYMSRALALAARGAAFVSPNPMVGAVIVAPDGRIIGEGWHRRYGGPHAEVNAVASVSPADQHLLPQSTIYVTLEPCSHYGKTPPCALLLIERGLRRCVVGAPDPFVKVAGRGIKMLRDAGIDVAEGVMQAECEALNCRFMTANRTGRPWVQLKWAESADGYVAALDADGCPRPVALSDPLTKVLMHRERAMADAIIVGCNTVLTDRPRLDVRLWPRRIDPLRVTISRHGRLDDTEWPGAEGCRTLVSTDHPDTLLRTLYSDHGVTSVMVEGGPTLLQAFIEAGLYDELRIERAPRVLGNGLPAPALPSPLLLHRTLRAGAHTIYTYRRPQGVKK